MTNVCDAERVLPERPKRGEDLDVPGFRKWVLARGGTLLAQKMHQEQVRYRRPGCEVKRIISVTDSGRVKYTNHADADYDDFLGLSRKRNKPKPKFGARLAQKIRSVDFMPEGSFTSELVRKSEGRCWYCGLEFGEGLQRATREHLTPVSRGGGSKIDNVYLVHFVCNTRMGNADSGIKRVVRLALLDYVSRKGKLDWDDFLLGLQMVSP